MNENSKIKIELPEAVRELIRTLKDAGYEAYAVGGCVRDRLLNKNPKDWDITTSALPEQVKSLFSNTVDTGIEHGTVMVIRRGKGYEVTTYRVDGRYADGRHPENVSFTRSLKEDLKRRDFTVNAFAYDEENGLTDLFDGQSDLENRLIRCVGDPDERFSEDALRIMRAVRFAAQLSFSIDGPTYEAIERHSDNLKNVSMERIREEFEKTLMSGAPGMTMLYRELGIYRYIISDDVLREKCFKEDNLKICGQIDPEDDGRYLRLAEFFRHLTPDETKKALRALKYDKITINTVSAIIAGMEESIPVQRAEVKKALCKEGERIFFMVSLLKQKEAGNNAGEAELSVIACKVAQDVIASEEPYLISHLAVNGKDLQEAGIKEGREIGSALAKMLDAVIADPALNTKETLLKMIM